MFKMNRERARIVKLTKSHFPTDVLGIPPDIANGSNRYRPICDWTPEVRAGRKTSFARANFDTRVQCMGII